MAKDIAGVVDGEVVPMNEDEGTVRLLPDKPPQHGSFNDVISLNGHKGEECQTLLVLLAR